MGIPVSKIELKNWCLRELGQGVIDINVSDAQANDRLDEAIAYFNDWHFDGSEKVLLKHTITASTMVFASATGTFTNKSLLTGQTSGTKGHVAADAAGLTVTFTTDLVGTTFTPGETVTADTGISGVLSTVTLGDFDNKYLPAPDAVLAVHQIIAPGMLGRGNMFDVQYQYMLNNIPNYTSMDVISYEMVMDHFQLLNDLFGTRCPFRFERYTNKLYLDFDWRVNAPVGTTLIIDAQRVLDPTTYSRMWGDEWLRRYATALIKRQWGANLKKMSGIQLAGGVTLNGQQIFDEASAEVLSLREECSKRYQKPVGLLVG